MNVEADLRELENDFNTNRLNDLIVKAASLIERLFRDALLERLRRSNHDERRDWFEQESQIGKGVGIERFSLVQLAAMNSKVKALSSLAENCGLIRDSKLNINDFATYRNQIVHGAETDCKLDRGYYRSILDWIENAGQILGYIASPEDLRMECPKNVYELYPLARKFVATMPDRASRC